jgi:hypothetical protein
MEFGDDGSMFVGETNRGWNSLGNRSYGLQRVIWSGHTPFEIKTMEALSDGFRCTFTKPVRPESVAATQWRIQSYTYEYHPDYGGPDIDVKELTVKAGDLSPDGLSIKLAVENLREGFVHELNITGLISKEGEPLVHTVAYYTLNRIPKP